jgi:hypothetical protein
MHNMSLISSLSLYSTNIHPIEQNKQTTTNKQTDQTKPREFKAGNAALYFWTRS